MFGVEDLHVNMRVCEGPRFQEISTLNLFIRQTAIRYITLRVIIANINREVMNQYIHRLNANIDNLAR